MLRIVRIHSNGRHSDDHVDNVASVCLTFRNEGWSNGLPGGWDNSGSRRPCSASRAPSSPPRTGERSSSFGNRQSQRLRGGHGSARAPCLGRAYRPCSQSSPCQSELGPCGARWGNGRYDFIVELGIAFAEIKKQPLQRFAADGRFGFFSPAAPFKSRLNLTPHRIKLPFLRSRPSSRSLPLAYSFSLEPEKPFFYRAALPRTFAVAPLRGHPVVPLFYRLDAWS